MSKDQHAAYKELRYYFIVNTLKKANIHITLQAQTVAIIIYEAMIHSADITDIEKAIQEIFTIIAHNSRETAESIRFENLEEQVRNGYLTIEKLDSPPVGEESDIERVQKLHELHTGLFHPQFNPDIEQDIKGEKK